MSAFLTSHKIYNSLLLYLISFATNKRQNYHDLHKNNRLFKRRPAKHESNVRKPQHNMQKLIKETLKELGPVPLTQTRHDHIDNNDKEALFNVAF